jgi:hypothetical protein
MVHSPRRPAGPIAVFHALPRRPTRQLELYGKVHATALWNTNDLSSFDQIKGAPRPVGGEVVQRAPHALSTRRRG